MVYEKLACNEIGGFPPTSKMEIYIFDILSSSEWMMYKA